MDVFLKQSPLKIMLGGTAALCASAIGWGLMQSPAKAEPAPLQAGPQSFPTTPDRAPNRAQFASTGTLDLPQICNMMRAEDPARYLEQYCEPIAEGGGIKVYHCNNWAGDMFGMSGDLPLPNGDIVHNYSFVGFLPKGTSYTYVNHSTYAQFIPYNFEQHPRSYAGSCYNTLYNLHNSQLHDGNFFVDRMANTIGDPLSPRLFFVPDPYSFSNRATILGIASHTDIDPIIPLWTALRIVIHAQADPEMEAIFRAHTDLNPASENTATIGSLDIRGATIATATAALSEMGLAQVGDARCASDNFGTGSCPLGRIDFAANPPRGGIKSASIQSLGQKLRYLTLDMTSARSFNAYVTAFDGNFGAHRDFSENRCALHRWIGYGFVADAAECEGQNGAAPSYHLRFYDGNTLVAQRLWEVAYRYAFRRQFYSPENENLAILDIEEDDRAERAMDADQYRGRRFSAFRRDVQLFSYDFGQGAVTAPANPAPPAP